MVSIRETTAGNNGGETQPITSRRTKRSPGRSGVRDGTPATPYHGGEVDMSEMNDPFKDSRIGEPELYSLADYECLHGNLPSEGRCDCGSVPE